MNGIMELIGLIKGASNPQQYLQQQAQNNPVIARALQMTQGKGDAQIMEVANNLARQQGINLAQFRQQLGI